MGDPIKSCPVHELNGTSLQRDQTKAPPVHKYLIC